MKAMNPGLVRRPFPLLDNSLVDLIPRFGDQFFDASRMDPAVADQAAHRQSGNFTTDRVKTAQNDCFRRVIDNNVNAGSVLKGPDVTSLPANDPAFHIVAGQRHGRDHGLGDLVGGNPLDGHGHNIARLPV
jgi:hypothetical protein